MTYLLLPHEVDATTATVWLGAIDEPALPQSLALDDHAIALDDAWQTWMASPGGRELRYRRFHLDGLAPGAEYTLSLQSDGQALGAPATVKTLPERLPAEGAGDPLRERPFTVLLGSCFYHKSPAAKRLADAYARLRPLSKPHVKVLCGDQVYLDAPWTEFLFGHPLSEVEMREHFLQTYLATWTNQGFSMLLRDGGNYFTSDDHEYWNNAPNPCAFAHDTWEEPRRSWWMNTAKELFHVFQTEHLYHRFSVGNLSFLSLDTRIDRDSIPLHPQPGAPTHFMSDDAMAVLRAWIDDLRGPGVLSLGQLLFDERAGELGRLKDWHLPNFSQYREMVDALFRARHSIVVLTGDVHFGRVAMCTLPSRQEIIEVIASPLALVAGDEPHYAPPPPRFPQLEPPVPGLTAVATQEVARPDRPANHFMTLGFTALGDDVEMKIDYWPVCPFDGRDIEAKPQRLAEHKLR